MTIESLRPGGPVHWGVMLAQGWKGELAGSSRGEAWDIACEWAWRAEQFGFDGLWLFDHFQPYPARDDAPMLEAWTTLAALSQVTSKISLGSLVSCAGYRAPAVTAAMARNLHALTGGRFCLGLGAGWDRLEFEALDVAFGTAGQRSDRLAATLRACRAVWPPAGDRPPVLVGGEGERHTLPAAVAHADVVNWQIGVDAFTQKSRLLSQFCEVAGRDPASLRRTHAPNFQIFESEHEFSRWKQDERRGMSAAEVDTYIRDRGALYGTERAIRETVEQFLAAGCTGFMIFCNEAPAAEALARVYGLRPLPNWADHQEAV